MRVKAVMLTAALLLCMTGKALAAGLNGDYEAMIGYEMPREALSPVSIALVDTGIALERLSADRIAEGENYVSRSRGDLVGHGTRIASLLIGAEDEEGRLSDLAPNATLVPLVYYSKYPSGVPINGGVEGICRGIYDAVDTYGCRIVVISSGVTQPEEALHQAVLYAETHNVIVISAAGNEGTTTPYYPASYPTVVGVGAVDEAQKPAAFSQRNEGVMVAAPGEGLSAVSIKNGIFFEEISGTSYACAYVAALASQLLGRHPEMTPEDFRWLLQNTCTDLLQPGYDTDTGFGLIHMGRGLEAYPALSATAPVPFYDVYASDWFYEPVYKAYTKGMMQGVSERFFRPEAPVTRGMLVTMLHRMEQEPEAAAPAAFSDVAAGSWYAGAVAWAHAAGIVQGVSEAEFAPEAHITREQLAAMLYRYAAYKGEDFPPGDSVGPMSYEDAAAVSPYAVTAMQWAREAGILQGVTETLLEPQGLSTRGQAAAVLTRMTERAEQGSSY